MSVKSLLVEAKQMSVYEQVFNLVIDAAKSNRPLHVPENLKLSDYEVKRLSLGVGIGYAHLRASIARIGED